MREMFCSNSLIHAPECGKCILRDPNFQNVPGEHAPGPPLEARTLWRSLKTPWASFKYLSAYFSNSAIYSISYWKPCISTTSPCLFTVVTESRHLITTKDLRWCMCYTLSHHMFRDVHMSGTLVRFYQCQILTVSSSVVLYRDAVLTFIWSIHLPHF